MNVVNVFKNQTLKTKTKIFSIFFFFAVLAIALCIVLSGVRRSFNSEAKQKIDQLGEIKVLQLDSELKGQIDLVLKLCTSPVFVSYLQHPEDEAVREIAFREIRPYMDAFSSRSVFFVSDANLDFYMNCEKSYTIDRNDPDSYWYEETMYETELYNFNVNYNSELKMSNLWINAVVRDEAGNPIGIAGTGIPLDGVFELLYADVEPNVKMYFYNKELEITGAQEESLVEDKVPVVQQLPEIAMHTVFLTTDEFIPLGAKSGMYGIRPVPTLEWYLVIYIPFSIRYVLTNILFITAIVMVVITLVIVLIFDSFIMRILHSMTRVLSETKEKASVQSKIVGSVNETFSSNIKNLDNFGSMMNTQSSKIGEAEQKIMDLLAQLSSMDALRVASLSDTKTLEKSSNAGSSQLQDLHEKIDSLSACAQRLYAANDLISSVTDQTSLLAINAAIEAAHAGDQGAGFAVVAKEIRNLAEKSRVQEEEVSASIENMNQMVGAMISYTETLKESFSVIVESSQSVVASFEEMSVSIEQQNLLGNSIGENLRAINTSVESTTQKFGEMKAENAEIANDVVHVAHNADGLLKSAQSALEVTGVKLA